MPFRQAAARAPLIIWSGPDCKEAGVGGVSTNRIITTVAYLWAKNRLIAVAHFILSRFLFIADLSSLT